MKLQKTLIITLVSILILLMISPIVLGATNYKPKDFESKIDTSATGTDNVKSVGGKIVGLVQVVGTIVSVGMLIVLGIKYMMGSAEERAEYKKTLFPYFIGAVLIFAASSLTQIIYSWASKL